MDIYHTAQWESILYIVLPNRTTVLVWVGRICGRTHYTMGWLSSANSYIVWVDIVCGRTHYTDRWDGSASHSGIWVGRVCGCMNIVLVYGHIHYTIGCHDSFCRVWVCRVCGRINIRNTEEAVFRPQYSPRLLY